MRKLRVSERFPFFESQRIHIKRGFIIRESQEGTSRGNRAEESTFEVKENTVLPSPWFTLTNNNGSHDFLSELRLTFLDGGNDQVTGSGSGEAV